jgi:phosphatidylglycerophosphate synthase
MKRDAHYEYRFEDHSLVLKVVEARMLVPLVRTLPRGLTPNQITVAGQIAAFAGFGIAVTVRPMTAIPFVLFAAAVLFSVFADAIDGLFARHSKQTSRLGEFLDHWLDALSVPLMVFAFALVLQAPPQLALLSAITTGLLHYTTLLHGFRIGYVHLGAIGMLEGTIVGAGACLAAAVFGVGLFTEPMVAGLSVGMVLLTGLVTGGCLAFLPMRGVFAWPRDFAVIVLVLATVWVWFIWGRLPLALAGLLAVGATAAVEGRVLRSRLLRVPLKLNDPVFMVLVCAGAVLAFALDLSAARQALIAELAAGYILGRNAIDFVRTVRALRAPLPSATSSAATASLAASD